MKIKEYIKLLQNNNVPFEKQEEALVEIEKAIKEAKQKKEELANKNADLIVSAFKQIEDKLNKKFEELLNTPAMKGEKGDKGDKGEQGPAGKDGIIGRDGKDGKDGRDGVDGKDGVSVVDAYIDFDGSLVIKLSNGNEIDAGRVVTDAVAKEFNAFMTRGEILPLQDGNAGKYLTTDGNTLSWATVSGGGGGSGTVTSVDMTVPTGLAVSGNPITTSGTLAVTYASGYAIPTTASQSNWDTAYSWGNHASAGYLTSAAIGSTVQAWDADLDTWATKTAPTGTVVGTSDTQTLTNKTITDLVFDGEYTEEVFTISDGASVDLDPSNGTIQLWTLGASRTPTATNFAAGQSMTLMVDDGTAYTITWPSVTWVNNGGVAPTLATTGYTVVALWKVSTTLYGALVGDGS